MTEEMLERFCVAAERIADALERIALAAETRIELSDEERSDDIE